LLSFDLDMNEPRMQNEVEWFRVHSLNSKTEFGTVVTAMDASTKLLYIGPG